LRTQLLALQRKLRQSDRALIILLAGVEGAGKGEVVNEINRWFDSRGVETHAFWDATDAESERPRYWRFWQRIPARTCTSVMFGSWYTAPIAERVFKRSSKAEFARELERIVAFENLLEADGTLII
jgi:polyphosphate kinase 2 (PPK2 family)